VPWHTVYLSALNAQENMQPISFALARPNY